MTHKKLKEQTLARFDEEFVPIQCVSPGNEFIAPDSIANSSRKDIKSFLSEALDAYGKALMEAVMVEEREVDYEERNSRVFNKIKKTDAFDDGFNTCRSEMESRYDKFMEV